MDSKFGLSIIDHGHHHRETRYLVEKHGVDQWFYDIYRWKEGRWRNVGSGLVERVDDYDEFVDVIATRLGPSDYEWELINYNAVTY